MDHEYPRLRHGLEASPVEVEGQRFFLLSDRLGYQGEALVLSPAVLRLLAEMNGENSLRDLQALFMKMTGDLIHTEELQRIIGMLDTHLYLENERFRSFLDAEIRRFQDDPVRRMRHAGKSYPQDPMALREELGKLFDSESTPMPAPGQQSIGRPLLGLMAPHIDIRAGAKCFARAYKVCRDAVAPDIWVILGTGHEPVQNYFGLLDKDFETPLGIVRCDHESCDFLSRHASRDLYAGSYNHRMEHSIEFQAVFLALIQPSARIVPLLCSFSEDDWERERTYIDEIAGLLKELVGVRGGSVGFLASVDLAHIGPRYGDSFIPNGGTVADQLSADRDLMTTLEACCAADFILKIAREQNQRRICGVAPIYTMTKALEGRAQGEILDHSFAPADNRNSFVTFASMAFYGERAEGEDGGQPGR